MWVRALDLLTPTSKIFGLLMVRNGCKKQHCQRPFKLELEPLPLALGNKAYVGTGFIGSTYFKDFWSFDGTQWVQEAALPAAFQARSRAVGFTLGNTAYVGTGFGSNTFYKDFWSFNGTQWVQEAALPAAFQARTGCRRLYPWQ